MEIDIRLIFYQLNIPDNITDYILRFKKKIETDDEINFQIKRFFFHSWVGGVLRKENFPYSDIYNSLYSDNVYIKYRPLRSNDILFHYGGPRNRNVKGVIWNVLRSYDRIYSDYLHHNICRICNPPFYIGKWMYDYLPINDEDYVNLNNKINNKKIGIPTMLADLNHYVYLIRKCIFDENYNISNLYLIAIYDICKCERCVRLNGYSKRFLDIMNVI